MSDQFDKKFFYSNDRSQSYFGLLVVRAEWCIRLIVTKFY